MQLTYKTAHLAWCALISLALARLDGRIKSVAQENIFLTRWFADAKKQRRFSRDVAPDLDWFLKEGRTLGVNAELSSKLHYVWRSCTGRLTEQNDLFRLTWALETAKERGWYYRLLNDNEWSGRHAIALDDSVDGIYIARSNLDAAFDDNGNYIAELSVRLTGNVDTLFQLLQEIDWQAEIVQNTTLPFLYRLNLPSV